MKRFRVVKTSDIVKGAEFFIPLSSNTWKRVKVVGTNPERGRCTVVDTEGDKGEAIEIEPMLVMLLPANKAVEGEDSTKDDLTNMFHLNEPAITENLEKRAMDKFNQRPYTRISNVLIAVNPLKYLREPKFIDFKGNSLSDAAPHPWGMAETAYRQMVMAVERAKDAGSVERRPSRKSISRKSTIQSRKSISRKSTIQSRKSTIRSPPEAREDQSIVISGESGAGKTETAKIVIKYLCTRPGIESTQASIINQQLMNSVPILESLGNATTRRNDNSSRFGKLLTLEFANNHTGTEIVMCGASITTYLLERSRVTEHAIGERNFHALYQLVAGNDNPDLWGKHNGDSLNFKSSHFNYLLSSGAEPGVTLDNVDVTRVNDDNVKFMETKAAFIKGDIGANRGDDKSKRTSNAENYFGVVAQLLAAVLHIGNITFNDTNDNYSGGCVISNDLARRSLNAAAAALGLEDPHKLEDVLLRYFLSDGTTLLVNDKERAIKARDTVAREVYSRLFNEVVRAVGKSMSSPDDVKRKSCIGVLDIFGFEYSDKNGLDQLLINFANETLQETFNKAVLVAEMRLYREEGLSNSATTQESDFVSSDSAETIKLIYMDNLKGPSIFSLLNTATQNPKFMKDPTEAIFCKSLHTYLSGNSRWVKPSVLDIVKTFIVAHYAENVTYTVGSFLSKNDNTPPPSLTSLLNDHSHFSLPAKTHMTSPPSLIFAAGSGKGERRVKPPVKTLVTVFADQMRDLRNSLDSTACHFIRCVKPNHKMEFGIFERGFVQDQLRAQGVPATCEVLKRGMPTRILYLDVENRYREKVNECMMNANTPSPKLTRFLIRRLDARGFTEAVLRSLNIPATSYKMGKTRCFFRTGEIAKLDQLFKVDMASKEGGEFIERLLKYSVLKFWHQIRVKIHAYLVMLKLLKFIQLEATVRLKEEQKNKELQALRDAYYSYDLKVREKIEKTANLVGNAALSDTHSPMSIDEFREKCDIFNNAVTQHPSVGTTLKPSGVGIVGRQPSQDDGRRLSSTLILRYTEAKFYIDKYKEQGSQREVGAMSHLDAKAEFDANSAIAQDPKSTDIQINEASDAVDKYLQSAGYLTEEANKIAQWVETNKFVNNEALLTMRSYIPNGFSEMNTVERHSSRMPDVLIKRLLGNNVLLLCRLHKNDIANLGQAELQSKYAPLGLDIVEMRAIWASIASVEFVVDNNNKKKDWKDGVLFNLMTLDKKEKNGQLSEKEVRHTAYKVLNALFDPLEDPIEKAAPMKSDPFAPQLVGQDDKSSATNSVPKASLENMLNNKRGPGGS
jgi:myosin heavy subunit